MTITTDQAIALAREVAMDDSYACNFVELTHEELTALKAQSTKPVAWEEAQETAYWDFDARRKGYPPYKGRPQSERDAFKQVLRNTTPPTATALVEDFKRRAIEVLENRATKWDEIADVSGELYPRSYSGELRFNAKEIESLPLFEGEI